MPGRWPHESHCSITERLPVLARDDRQILGIFMLDGQSANLMTVIEIPERVAEPSITRRLFHRSVRRWRKNREGIRAGLRP